MANERTVETLVRRATAVLVACQTFMLAAAAFLAWELADGVIPEPGPPTPASVRLAAAAPYLFLLPWFVVGGETLWNARRLPTLLRMVERAVLCVVALANLYAVSLFAAGRYASTEEAIVFIPGCLAVAGISLLVIMGKLRGQPLAG